MQKYLCMDHGGVLDGEYIQEAATDDDLVLAEIMPGLFQVLRDGVKIVELLGKLHHEFGCQLAFHSKNRMQDQITILEKLRGACFTKDIEWPDVAGMAVFDDSRFPGINSNQPRITRPSMQGSVPEAGYGIELDGKRCVRRSLTALFQLTEQDSQESLIIFDDAPPVIDAATSDGYEAYCIGSDPSLNQISLFEALTHTYNNLCLQQNQDALPASDVVNAVSMTREALHYADRIVPGIYIGNLISSELSLDNTVDGSFDVQLNCRSEVLTDAENNVFMDVLFDYINQIKAAVDAGNSVLLYDDTGLCNSPFVVIIYLVTQQNISFLVAYETVQQMRDNVNVSALNTSFRDFSLLRPSGEFKPALMAEALTSTAVFFPPEAAAVDSEGDVFAENDDLVVNPSGLHLNNKPI